MCTYDRTVFSCAHISWGSMVKRCDRVDDVRAGKRASYNCKVRQGHPIKSRNVPSKCARCQKTDQTLVKTKALFAAWRAELRSKGWKGDSDSDGDSDDVETVIDLRDDLSLASVRSSLEVNWR